MLEAKGHMNLNEFYATACAMVPVEATRYGRISRLTIVRNWIRSYRRNLTITDAAIEYKKPAALERKGHLMLKRLKEQGKITLDESGFNKQTWRVYVHALRALQWVVVADNGELLWCGPNESEWVMVTRWRRRIGRPKQTQDEATE